MILRSWVAAGTGVGALFFASAANAGADDVVRYGPVPAWVLPPPVSAAGATTSDAPVRFAYLDSQVDILADGTQQTYTAYRLKVAKPEGLPAGNINLAWLPDTGGMTIHYVRLIRDGRTTDVLASAKFTVLQREAQLEQSVLTGQRTATLQIPGLQVGDEIALAATVSQRDRGLDGRVAGLDQLPVVGTSGAFRFRLAWPQTQAVRWQASKDLPSIQPSVERGRNVLDWTLRDPPGAIPTEGAPARYNVRRLVEFSSYASWADVSRRLAPMFDAAAVLRPGSPVGVEAAAIAARTKDPAERAEAALQLVEDRIRYVCVALDGGSYVPAAADETWQRRFGDCKAKTVLLVALLRAMGIEAVPALVNSRGGDGLDQRLPGPRVFDHMIARAVVGGKPVWLDGTRLGDRHLDTLPLPYRWALPLREAGAPLEPIAPHDDGFPEFTGIVDIDASAGVDRDSHVRVRHIVRGDEAFGIRTQLAAMTTDDADRALKSYWHQQVDWVTPDKVSWRYDERRRAISMELDGEGNPGWKGDAAKGHTLTITGAGFYPPDIMRRPKDQDQSAPWQVTYPHFRCWATTIRLPKPGATFDWSLYAEPMNQRLGGTLYWRNAGMAGAVLGTVMSSHNYEPEATPAEAERVNRAIPNFNNNMSSIAEETPANTIKGVSTRLPFADDVDWMNRPTPCAPPVR